MSEPPNWDWIKQDLANERVNVYDISTLKATCLALITRVEAREDLMLRHNKVSQ